MMREIIHQKQPTQKSCVSTCFAMLANLPAEEVIEKYHDGYVSGQMSPIYISAELGIEAVPMSSISRALHFGSIYLVSAQSLNYPQVSHQIIVDCRWDDGYRIYDPQMGNDGSKFYVPHYIETSEEETPLAVPYLGGWHADFRILDCPVMRDE